MITSLRKPRSTVARQAGAATAGMVLLVTLAGCFALEGAPNGLVSIRSSGTHYDVAVCTDLDVSTIYIVASEASYPFSTRVVADSAWSQVVEAGDVFTTQSGQANSLPVQEPEPVLQPGEGVSISLHNGSTAHPQSAQADFEVPETGVPADGWLHQDGSVSQQPCV